MGDDLNGQPPEDDTQYLLAAFQKSEARKAYLFWGLVVFLILDALAFIALLGFSFYAVLKDSATWHLFAAPALSGTLLAVLTVILVKGVFSIGHDSSGAELPAAGTMADMAKELGG